jgi:exopolysaccharide biosynthesis polyprenyl glycosylphosphotransferase
MRGGTVSTSSTDPVEGTVRPVVALEALSGDSVLRRSSWRRQLRAQWPLLAALVAVPPAVQVGTMLDVGAGPLALGLTLVAVWVVVSACRTVTRRGLTAREHLLSDAGTAGVLASVTGLGTVVGLVRPEGARSALVVLGTAAIVTWALRSVQPRVLPARRVVLVGTRSGVETYLGDESHDVVVGCYLLDGGAAQPVSDRRPVPTTTSLDTVPDLAVSTGADMALVLPGPGSTPDLVRRLTWKLERTSTKVGVVCPVSEVAAHRLRPRVSHGGTVLELGAPHATVLRWIGKGLLDRVGALVLLVVASPLLVMLWAAVRLDSPGPGLFVQTRVGLGGRPFRMYKLRSMHRDAESALDALLDDNECDGTLFKIRRDPRVTRVGYWLRRSSLDELPQLLNVLRGEMSLVGPRPALPSEVATYDEVARRRLVVKPGITGLWQVSGRSDLLWDESVRLDLYYADNWRLLDDLSIAARTVRAVTRARGAY